MAVVVDATTRIIIQGMTGHTGRNLAAKMVDEGSPLVGGVAPGRGGQAVAGLPIFDSCYEAVVKLGVNASFLSVPPAGALDAALEALDAGIQTLVVYTEGVPVLDAVRMRAYAGLKDARLIGPNAAGCISPGLANLSDLNAGFLRPGPVGIVSKSGTLTYEVIDDLNRFGLGQSTVICLGGDPVIGMSHRDALELFEDDPDTRAIVLIGEIGGCSERDAAEFIARMTKPVVAYIAGRHAPAGKRMGHAGALLGAPEESAEAKCRALEKAGAVTVDNLMQVGGHVLRLLAPRKRAAAPSPA